jgi:hypothetical protein
MPSRWSGGIKKKRNGEKGGIKRLHKIQTYNRRKGNED